MIVSQLDIVVKATLAQVGNLQCDLMMMMKMMIDDDDDDDDECDMSQVEILSEKLQQNWICHWRFPHTCS